MNLDTNTGWFKNYGMYKNSIYIYVWAVIQFKNLNIIKINTMFFMVYKYETIYIKYLNSHYQTIQINK